MPIGRILFSIALKLLCFIHFIGFIVSENHKIDNLDRQIIAALQQDARTPYAELAKRVGVSAATVHVRVEKLRQAGIVAATRAIVNPRALGYDVCCFIGINLKSARDYNAALQRLNELDEVVEAFYTTGHYNIFIKVMTRSIDELHTLLTSKIQTIDEIQSTETLISLHNPISRQVVP